MQRSRWFRGRAGASQSCVVRIAVLKECQICRRQAPDHICGECEKNIKFVSEPKCHVCALPLQNRYSCPDCNERRFAFSSTTAVALYEGIMKYLIHSVKFGLRLHMMGGIESLVRRKVPELRAVAPDVIMPVPFSINSIIQRGIDVPTEVARLISRLLEARMHDGCVIKRISREQRFLRRDDRLANPVGTFIARSARLLRFRRVLIVDDIMSTGATVDELSRVLLDHGVQRVDVFVIARTPYRRKPARNF